MTNQFAIPEHQHLTAPLLGRTLRCGAVQPLTAQAADRGQVAQVQTATEPAQRRAFTQVPLHATDACPLTPRRCPFGGACHSCPMRVQAKLTVSQPGDKYEEEADRIADQVMSMPEPQVQRACPTCDEEETAQTKPLAEQITPLVQRQAASEEEDEEEPVQTKPLVQRQAAPEEEDKEESVQIKLMIQRQAEEDEGEEEPVQRKALVQRQAEDEKEEEAPVQTKAATQQPTTVSPALSTQVQSLRGGGQPLSVATRAFFEPRFGADFSGVRMHTDAHAAATARSLGARAYTVGRDVVFGAEEYAGGAGEGRRLLAHELAHVVQQQSANLTDFPQVQQQTDTKSRPPKKPLAKPSESEVLARAIHAIIHETADKKSVGTTFFAKVKGLAKNAIRNLEYYYEREYAKNGSINRGICYETKTNCYQLRQDILKQLPITLANVIINYLNEMNPMSLELTVNRPEMPIGKKERISLLNRIVVLGNIAEKDGVAGKEFQKIILEFTDALEKRLSVIKYNEPLPSDIQLIIQSLALWSNDPGDKWDRGIWLNKKLIMSAKEYATVPAIRNKCNIFVAEVAYRSLGIVFKAIRSEEEIGKYYPHRASEWGNPDTDIKWFSVVSKPKMGDIWSNGSHVGIYLGEYQGKKLYISARSLSTGTFGVGEIQKEGGIQIKYSEEGGIYRRYNGP